MSEAMYNLFKRNHDRGKVTEEQFQIAIEKGYLTPEEVESIKAS